MKVGRHRVWDRRWWIGIVVLVAIVAILGIKALGTRPVVSAIPFSAESLGQASAVSEVTDLPRSANPALGPMEPTASTAQPPAPQLGAQSDLQTTASQLQESLPQDPIGQIDWAMRHSKPMMVLFHSTTCIPCKAMEKLIAQIRGDFEPGIVFVDVITNDRANVGLIRQAGIRGIPTSFFVSPSGTGKRHVGALNEEALRAQLEQLLKGE